MASNATPTPKVAAAGVSGAVAIILVWIAGLFGLEVPAEVAAAVAAILAFAGGYLTRDASSPGRHEAV